MTVPLERVLGAEVGAIYRDIHTDHGVRMLLGTRRRGVRGNDGGRAGPHQRRADARLRLRRRRRRRASRAPRSPPRAASTLTTGSSSTSTCRPACPGVFAAGDVAMTAPPALRAPDPRRALGQRAAPGAGRRPQHARPIGAAMTACRTSSPTSTTSAWSTRATPPTWDRVVLRGDPASREFIAFWLRGRSRARRHERQRLGRHRPRSSVSSASASPSTTGASPTPTFRSRTSSRPRERARHEPPRAAARRRRLDLA